MTKQEWLVERQKGIGGSEASAILGLNPYMNNVQLWRIKTGKSIPEEKDNPQMEYGRLAEAPLITLFGLNYPQYKVILKDPYTLQKHPKYPFLLGTVDADLVIPAQNDKDLADIEKEAKGFLEIKTTSGVNQNLWKDTIPYNYYIQCLHYMLVNPKYEFFWIKVQIKRDRDEYLTKHYYFGYNDEQVKKDMEMLLEKEKEFWWDYVEKNVEPPLALPPF